jgi:hypothetical protein
MMAVNFVVDELSARLDPESAEWLRVLAVAGSEREAALTRLHGTLLRVAQREVRRRAQRLRITGPELEDLAYQAAADVLPPSPAPSGSGCPQLHRPAATRRRRRSPTSTRNDSASRRKVDPLHALRHPRSTQGAQA